MSIVKCNTALLKDLTSKGLAKELATFLLLKTVCESGYIFSYLRNPKCLALVKRDTLYRHVKTLIAEGLIHKCGVNLRLIGAEKIAERFDCTRNIKLKTENLNYEIIKTRIYLSIQGQKSKIREHNKHRVTGNTVKKHYRGNYVTTDSSDCPNLSVKGLANMFGNETRTSGYAILKKLVTDVTRIHRVETTPTGNKYLSCEIQMAIIRKREYEPEIYQELRKSFSYCSNDCVGW